MIKQIIKVVKNYQSKSRIQYENEFLIKGNSHLLSEFRLRLTNPTPGKKYLKIGDDSSLECHVTFESPEGEVIIGNRCIIGGSQLISRSKIEIEDDVFIAWGTYLYDHNSHSLDYRHREEDLRQQIADYRSGGDILANKDWSHVVTKPIKVCSHAWIGLNCLILKGVTIGRGAIVGAGSVVTKDVPAWTVVAGNPARVVKELPLELRK